MFDKTIEKQLFLLEEDLEKGEKSLWGILTPQDVTKEEPFRGPREHVPGTWYDYSHTLSPEQRTAGYQLHVWHNHTGHNSARDLMAYLYHHGKKIGVVEGAKYGSAGLKIGYSHLDPKHRRKGLGIKAYESVMAHAHNNMGIDHMYGGFHSTQAHNVHRAIAQRHGLSYEGMPNTNPVNRWDTGTTFHSTLPGDFDNRYEGYKYTLKHEFDEVAETDTLYGKPLLKEEDENQQPVDPDPIMAALKSKTVADRTMAFHMDGFGEEHLKKALQDTSRSVLARVVHHPLFTKEFFNQWATKKFIQKAADYLVNQHGNPGVAPNFDVNDPEYLKKIHEAVSTNKNKTQIDPLHVYQKMLELPAAPKEAIDYVTSEKFANTTKENPDDYEFRRMLNVAMNHQNTSGDTLRRATANVEGAAKNLAEARKKWDQDRHTLEGDAYDEAENKYGEAKRKLSLAQALAMEAIKNPNLPEDVVSHFADPKIANLYQDADIHQLDGLFYNLHKEALAHPKLSGASLENAVDYYVKELENPPPLEGQPGDYNAEEKRERIQLANKQLLDSIIDGNPHVTKEMLLKHVESPNKYVHRAIFSSPLLLDDPKYLTDAYLEDIYEAHRKIQSAKTLPPGFWDKVLNFSFQNEPDTLSSAVKALQLRSKVMDYIDTTVIPENEVEKVPPEVFGKVYDKMKENNIPWNSRLQLFQMQGIDKIAPQSVRDDAFLSILSDDADKEDYSKRTWKKMNFYPSEQAYHTFFNNIDKIKAPLESRMYGVPNRTSIVEQVWNNANHQIGEQVSQQDFDNVFNYVNALPKNLRRSDTELPQELIRSKYLTSNHITQILADAGGWPSSALRRIFYGNADMVDPAKVLPEHMEWFANLRPDVYNDEGEVVEKNSGLDDASIKKLYNKILVESDHPNPLITPEVMHKIYNNMDIVDPNGEEMPTIFAASKYTPPDLLETLADQKSTKTVTFKDKDGNRIPVQQWTDLGLTLASNPNLSDKIFNKLLDSADTGEKFRILGGSANSEARAERVINAVKNAAPPSKDGVPVAPRRIDYGDYDRGLSEADKHATLRDIIKRNESNVPFSFIKKEFDELGGWKPEDDALSNDYHASEKDKARISYKKALKGIIESVSPSSVYGNQTIHVKVGSHKLRVARNLIESSGNKSVHMKELGPGDWGPFRTAPGRQDISADKIQEAIDKMPSEKFHYSFGKWTGVQRHNEENSQVFRVNLADEHIKKLREAGVYGVWRKIQNRIKQFHPIEANTIGWVRFTGDPKDGSVHIDEIQSDNRQTMFQHDLANELHYMREQNPNLTKEDIEKKAAEVKRQAERNYGPVEDNQKMQRVLFGEGPKGSWKTDPHEIIIEAFKEFLRNQGHHNVTIHLPGSEFRSSLSGLKGYPHHGMGFDIRGGARRTDQDLIEIGKKRGLTAEEIKTRKPPVHYMDTYERNPKRMGYNLNAAQYGDEKTETNVRDYGGMPMHTTKVLKFEEDVDSYLKKMAVENNPFGTVVSRGPRKVIYDYSHLLPDDLKNQGYSIRVTHSPVINTKSLYYYDPSMRDARLDFLTADLYHGPQPVGGVSSDITRRPGDPRVPLNIGLADIMDGHSGKGMGPLLYEALMTHAKKGLGATHVMGEAHSTLASKVHRKLAEKHGFKYIATPNIGANLGNNSNYMTREDWEKAKQGPYDARFAGYKYTLKSEGLSKAAKKYGFKGIQVKATNDPTLHQFLRGDDAGGIIGNKQFKAYDYSHLLAAPHRKDGYKLYVVEQPWYPRNTVPGSVPPSYITLQTIAFRKGRDVGGVFGNMHPENGAFRMHEAYLEPLHQGKGLGKAMYAAAYSHAVNKHGANRVTGSEHSSMAALAHSALARRFNLSYGKDTAHGPEDQKPNEEFNPEGDYDARFGDYNYTLDRPAPINLIEKLHGKKR